MHLFEMSIQSQFFTNKYLRLYVSSDLYTVYMKIKCMFIKNNNFIQEVR